jgi:uncharacterized Zn-finger protein
MSIDQQREDIISILADEVKCDYCGTYHKDECMEIYFQLIEGIEYALICPDCSNGYRNEYKRET